LAKKVWKLITLIKKNHFFRQLKHEFSTDTVK
jgi:hypothetical protein